MEKKRAIPDQSGRQSVTRFIFRSLLQITDVSRKNKVTDNLVKIELDIDQASMKAFTQFHDKRF